MSASASLVRGPWSRRLAAGWLALSLIVAQLAGLAHRVQHPLPPSAGVALERHAAQRPLGDAEAHLCEQAGDHAHPPWAAWLRAAVAAGHAHDGHEAPEHDCAAYDALTLGDAPPLALDPAAGTPLPAMRPAPIAERRSPAPLALAYRTRAPPSA
jgi:hypothetical protein